MNSLLLIMFRQVNSYIKSHTELNKLVETMSHLKFNVDLVRALLNKERCFTPKARSMEGVALFYIIDSNINNKKVVCMVCTTKMNWYCPTNDDTIIFLGACFMKLNNTFA